mmetsp:Transcript_40105/g.104542  ORF Transcript_40105/g.104542 Transcript_40105/m.104542 type:complete len:267 (-) Transcript_40105:860-1660(-)
MRRFLISTLTPSTSQPLLMCRITCSESPLQSSSAISSAELCLLLMPTMRCQVSAARSALQLGARSTNSRPDAATKHFSPGTWWRSSSFSVHLPRLAEMTTPSRPLELCISRSLARWMQAVMLLKVESVGRVLSLSSGSEVYSYTRFMAMSWYCAEDPVLRLPSTPTMIPNMALMTRLAVPTSVAPGIHTAISARPVTKMPPRMKRRLQIHRMHTILPRKSALIIRRTIRPKASCRASCMLYARTLAGVPSTSATPELTPDLQTCIR